jgi:Holliday junction resolvasome RuvABC endonuclease subunit
MAYAVCTIKHNKAVITNCGMLWTKDSWSKGRRFSYMKKAITYLMLVYNPSKCFTEAFFANPKLLAHSAVIPTVNGLIELCSYDQGDLPYNEVSPSWWRSVLNIKPTKTEGKRDYKIPTAQAVKEALPRIAVPEVVLSNVTGKERATPHDMTDVLAIVLSLLKANNITSIDLTDKTFYNENVLKYLKEMA